MLSGPVGRPGQVVEFAAEPVFWSGAQRDRVRSQSSGTVNPPAAVKQTHADLVKTMNDLGDDFPAIAKQLNSSGKDPSAAINALFGAKAIQELIKVGNEFKGKGYNLDLNP